MLRVCYCDPKQDVTAGTIFRISGGILQGFEPSGSPRLLHARELPKGMTEPTHGRSNPTPSGGDVPMTPNAMTDTALNTQDETLTFDVSDEALEITASAPSGQVNFTLANCTGLSACPA